jgi:hypothetical protein
MIPKYLSNANHRFKPSKGVVLQCFAAKLPFSLTPADPSSLELSPKPIGSPGIAVDISLCRETQTANREIKRELSRSLVPCDGHRPKAMLIESHTGCRV